MKEVNGGSVSGQLLAGRGQVGKLGTPLESFKYHQHAIVMMIKCATFLIMLW